MVIFETLSKIIQHSEKLNSNNSIFLVQKNRRAGKAKKISVKTEKCNDVTNSSYTMIALSASKVLVEN